MNIHFIILETIFTVLTYLICLHIYRTLYNMISKVLYDLFCLFK